MNLKKIPKGLLIPKACADHVIRSGTNLRVSDCAALEMGRILEHIGKQLAEDAAVLVKHSKKGTIFKRDIQEAFKHFKRIKEIELIECPFCFETFDSEFDKEEHIKFKHFG